MLTAKSRAPKGSHTSPRVRSSAARITRPISTRSFAEMAALSEGVAVNRTTVAAIIPAYLEEKHVGDVARRTLAQLDQVLVVDDGSPDATAENARAGGAQ